MTLQRLRELLDAMTKVRTLVVGDAMMDEYIWGRAERISQEAPVLVLRSERETRVPGGAANVVHCVTALGAAAGLCAVAGNDSPAEDLRLKLSDLGVTPVVLLCDVDRPTTIKTRVVASAQQVVRIDREDRSPIPIDLVRQLDAAAVELLPQGQGLLLSDYDKGVLTPQSIPALLRAAKELGLQVAVNAKPRHAAAYHGVDLFTVNRSEAEAICSESCQSVQDAGRCAKLIAERIGCGAVLITLGPDGAVLGEDGQISHVPAVPVEVYDPAGAGDTTIAAAHAAMCAGATAREAAELAMLAAAVVVRKVGVATARPEEVLKLAG